MVDLQRALEVVADAVHRVERRERILQDHLDFGRIRPGPSGRRRLALEQNLSLVGPNDLGQQPRDGGLPRPALAHERRHLPGVQANGDVVHGVHRQLAGKRPAALLEPEVLGEVAALEDRRRHRSHCAPTSIGR